jgi:hypothetical protein
MISKQTDEIKICDLCGKKRKLSQISHCGGVIYCCQKCTKEVMD